MTHPGHGYDQHHVPTPLDRLLNYPQWRATGSQSAIFQSFGSRFRHVYCLGFESFDGFVKKIVCPAFSGTHLDRLML